MPLRRGGIVLISGDGHLRTRPGRLSRKFFVALAVIFVIVLFLRAPFLTPVFIGRVRAPALELVGVLVSEQRTRRHGDVALRQRDAEPR